MFRRRKQPDGPVDPLAEVDARAVPARFGPAVADALDARRRFAAVRDGVRPGPTRDRLIELGAGVDGGVLGVWGTVRRAVELDAVLTSLDPERVTQEYKAAKRAGGPSEVLDSLGARFASVQRLLKALDDVEDRLRLLDARLGEAVARAAEVALVAGDDVAALDAVERDLAALTGDLAALQAGLDEVSG